MKNWEIFLVVAVLISFFVGVYLSFGWRGVVRMAGVMSALFGPIILLQATDKALVLLDNIGNWRFVLAIPFSFLMSVSVNLGWVGFAKAPVYKSAERAVINPYWGVFIGYLVILLILLKVME